MSGYISTYESRAKLRYDTQVMSYRGLYGVLNKFNATNNLWNDNYFNSAKKVGCISAIIKDAAYYFLQIKGGNKSISDLTLEQFYHYYFNVSPLYRLDIDIPDELCGITAKEMFLLAKELKEVAAKGDKFGNKFDLSDIEALEYILIRVLDQTYEGFQNELQIANDITALLPLTCSVSLSSGKEDKDTGVDLYIVANQKLLAGIQVKPMSFFSGFDRNYIRKARKEHDIKHLDFTKKNSVKVYYVVKDKDSKLYSVESKSNVNLKENLQDNLDGLLKEIQLKL